MTRLSNQFFMQQQFKEMNFHEPAFAFALLGAQPGSPEHEQFDSAQEDVEEDEGDTASAFNAELNITTGEETDASGCPAHMSSADRHHLRNCTLLRERNRACQEVRRPKNRWLSFPMFKETTKEG